MKRLLLVLSTLLISTVYANTITLTSPVDLRYEEIQPEQEIELITSNILYGGVNQVRIQPLESKNMKYISISPIGNSKVTRNEDHFVLFAKQPVAKNTYRVGKFMIKNNSKKAIKYGLIAKKIDDPNDALTSVNKIVKDATRPFTYAVVRFAQLVAYTSSYLWDCVKSMTIRV